MKYTGKYESVLKSLVRSEGGAIEVEITRCREQVISRATIRCDDSGLSLECDGQQFSCFSHMITYIEKKGLVCDDIDGCNTEGGNSSDNVLGNWDIFGNIVYKGTPLIVAIGVKRLDELFDERNPNKKSSKKNQSKTKESMVDNRPFLSNKAEVYKKHNLDYRALTSKFGKDLMLREAQILTVNEWCLRYGVNVLDIYALVA